MWVTPIIDRVNNDVIYIKYLNDKILLYGYSSLTIEEDYFWKYGELLTVYDENGDILETSDSDILILGNGTIKGILNAQDLNRIEGNCYFIKNKLETEGYFVNITIKATWQETELPYLTEEINRIRNNVISLVEQYLASGQTPNILINNYLNYTQVNNLEVSLLLIKNTLEYMISQYNFCGTLVSGEVY